MEIALILLYDLSGFIAIDHQDKEQYEGHRNIMNGAILMVFDHFARTFQEQCTSSEQG